MHGPDGFATSVYKKDVCDRKKMDPQFVKAIHEVDGKPVPNFKAAVVPVEAHDGLIIDATEQNFRPAPDKQGIHSQRGAALRPVKDKPESAC